jgi:hypothetical protein
MFKVGNLVKRIKVLYVSVSDYDWVPYTGEAEEYGIVVDVEEPIKPYQTYRIEYPEVFVKVLWQNADYGPTWHWGDELAVVKGKKKD